MVLRIRRLIQRIFSKCSKMLLWRDCVVQVSLRCSPQNHVRARISSISHAGIGVELCTADAGLVASNLECVVSERWAFVSDYV